MAEQRQSFGPGRVLGQVTVIVALPLLGGVIAGLVVDGLAGTSPLFVLSGLAIGSLVTILWLRAFVTTTVARLRGPSEGSGAGIGDGHGQQRQDSTERS